MSPTANRGAGRAGTLDPVTAAIDDLDEAGLRSLLAVRPDLADPPPGSRSELVVRAASSASVKVCIETLDKFAIQVLTACAVVGDGAPADSVRASLGVDGVDVERALDVLAARYLVRREGAALRLHPVVRSMPSPAGLGLPAAALLAELTVEDLKAVCDGLGVTLRGGERKAAIVELLAGALADAERVQSVCAKAPEGARALAARLAGGPPVVYDGYGLASAYSRYATARELALPHVWLARRGIVVRHEWSGAMMPREVALALRDGRLFASVAGERPVLTTAPGDPARVDDLAQRALLATISAVERLVEHLGTHPATLLKAGGLGVRELRKLAAATEMSERDATLLVELAAAADLVASDWSTHRALPSASSDDWLMADAAARWGHLVASWLATPTFPSLAGIDDDNGKPYPALSQWAPHRAPVRQRRLLLERMHDAGREVEVDLDSLARQLDWDAPVLFADGPATVRTHTAWIWREAQMLGLGTAGALSSTGAALVTAGLGAAMEVVERSAPRASSTFVLQADLTAVTAGPLEAPVRRELDLLADVESTGAATVHRFSEASVCRGFDAGRSADDILEFLSSHGEKGVPQALSYLVGDVARRFGQLRAGDATCYVRVEDPATAAEVLRAKRTARLGLRQIAPTVLVASSSVAAVLEALRAAGFHPAHEDVDGALVTNEPTRHRAGGGAPRSGSGSGSTRAGALGDRSARLLRHDDDRESQIAELARRLASMPRGGTSALTAGGGTFAAKTTNGNLLRLLSGSEVRTEDSGARDLLATIADLVGGRNGLVRPTGPERPRAIAREPAEVARLLDDACENDWLVRLSFTSRGTTALEATCDVLDIADDTAYLVEMSTGDEIEVPLDAIAWSRALTEAEEEQWY